MKIKNKTLRKTMMYLTNDISWTCDHKWEEVEIMGSLWWMCGKCGRTEFSRDIGTFTVIPLEEIKERNKKE